MSQKYFVAKKFANLRRDPQRGAPLVTQATFYQPATGLEMEGDWIKVILEDGTEGWTEGRLLVNATAGDTAGVPAVVNVPRAPLWRAPMGRTIGDISMGTRIPVFPMAGDYGSLTRPGKRNSMLFIRKADIDYADEEPRPAMDLSRAGSRITGQSAIGTKAARLCAALIEDGTRFKEGGTTAFGLGDAGLVWLVYGVAGLQLPRVREAIIRDSNFNALSGNPLPKQGLHSGDVLVFGDPTNLRLGLALSSSNIAICWPETFGIQTVPLYTEIHGRNLAKVLRPKN